MLIWTLSRKKAAGAVILMGIVMAALIVLMGRLPEEEVQPTPLADNASRVAYLASLGWEVEPEPVETLQFLLPEVMTPAYQAYNKLQLPQGFDLTSCLGRQISRYTYTVTNYPSPGQTVQANLYLCDDLPVAGDLCCPGEGGFQEMLIQPREQVENS